MKRDIENTLKEKLYECNQHKQKIYDAQEYLEPIMPLSLENYLSIDKIQSSFIDQLNFRFSKLQDTIGESLFKSILILGKENTRKMTFLDILNRIEELEIVEKNTWLALREARNEIAHEYSFNQVEVVENINLIYKKSNQIIDIYDRVYSFLNIKFRIK